MEMKYIKSLREKPGTYEIVFNDGTIKKTDEKHFQSLWHMWLGTPGVKRTDHDGWIEFSFLEAKYRLKYDNGKATRGYDINEVWEKLRPTK